MSQTVETACRTFIAGGAIAKYLRVILTAGKLAKAGVADLELGNIEDAAFANGDYRAVRLRTAQGTKKWVSAGSITAGNIFYAAANGTVDSTGTIPCGIALETAASGDIFEGLPLNDFSAVVQSINPAADSGAGSKILPGSSRVDVGAVVNDANDWIVLPPIADVPIGWTIRIAANAGGNFEMRTPASSNTKINDVDADGSQEYLCTDTHLIIVTKRTTTGWVAQSLTKLGAVVTAVVPD